MEALKNYPHTGWLVFGIIAFFLVRVAVGYWASRQVKNVADFVVAGRGMPIYITAASIMATWFAGETLLGASHRGYEYGFHGVISDPLGATVCLVISGMFFIRLMRRARYLTVVDFFRNRFGNEMNMISAVIQLAAYFAWTAAQFVAGGVVIHNLFGMDAFIGIATIGVVVTFYTLMGGMLADTLLDFVQMFFTSGGMLAVFLAVLSSPEIGGWEGLVNHHGTVFTKDAFSLLPHAEEGYLGYRGTLGYLLWISAWITLGVGSIATQDLMQRSMSARNEATSVWGSYFAGFLYLVFGIMSPLVGIMLYKIDPSIAESHREGVLVIASVQFLPVWVNVIFIAALISALMSTADSSILAGASVVTENMLPYFYGELSDRQKLFWTRIMVLFIGFACIGIAAAIGDLYQLAMLSWSFLLVGLFVPFWLGMYWRGANRSGAIASSLGGGLFWLVSVALLYPTTHAMYVEEDGTADWMSAIFDAASISSPLSVIAGLLLMIGVSRATRSWDHPLLLTDVDGVPLDMTNRLGTMSFFDCFREEKSADKS